MEKLLRRIELSEDAECAPGADRKDILLCNRKLNAEGLPEIPEAWQGLLAKHNGIYCDGAEVFAVPPAESPFSDVLQMNRDIVWEQNDGVLLLGQNESDVLAYDDGVYLILERGSEEVRHQTSDAETAAGYILRL